MTSDFDASSTFIIFFRHLVSEIMSPFISIVKRFPLPSLMLIVSPPVVVDPFHKCVAACFFVSHWTGTSSTLAIFKSHKPPVIDRPHHPSIISKDSDRFQALDPVLAEFERAKDGNPDVEFWKSMFRFNSGSGPSVMTGWVNVLFPYLKHAQVKQRYPKHGGDQLYPNPYLADWQERLAIDDRQHWQERFDNPQGVGMSAIPSCCTSVPLKVHWGQVETPMRLVGGLMGVSQDEDTLTVEPGVRLGRHLRRACRGASLARRATRRPSRSARTKLTPARPARCSVF